MVCNDLRVCGHVPAKPSVPSLLVVWFDLLLPRLLFPLGAQASHIYLCFFFGLYFCNDPPFFFFFLLRKARVKGRKKKTRLLLPASNPRRNNTYDPKETAASPRFLSAARPGDLSPGVRCSTGHCGSLTLN